MDTAYHIDGIQEFGYNPINRFEYSFHMYMNTVKRLTNLYQYASVQFLKGYVAHFCYLRLKSFDTLIKVVVEHKDKIMELFANRKDEQYLAKLVKNDDILENDCNLSVSSYVEQEDTREVINISEVNAKLKTLVAESNELNQKIDIIINNL